MDFDVLDEHEQGELVQKWLRENVMSIIVGVLLGIALIFGWQQWKVHRARHSVDTAAQFQAMSDAVAAKRQDDADKIAEALRKDDPSSVYAALAAMSQADASAQKGDLAAAATSLDWTAQHAGSAALKALATIRLARVKLAQDDADGAIKLIDGLDKGLYPSLAAEGRGDALKKLGRADAARTAYQDALGHLDAQAPGRALVQMKLDDLGIASAAASVPVQNPAPVQAPAPAASAAPAKNKVG